MPLIASDAGNAGSSIPLCETGIYPGVVAHVCDLGMEPYQEKWLHKVVLLIEIDQLITEAGSFQGKRYMLSAKYTISMNEKANLRKALEQWRGKAFTPVECQAFDLEKLKGKPCQVLVGSYVGKDGKERRSIQTILPPAKGSKPMVPETAAPPEWIAKQKAKNDAAYSAHMASHGDNEPVVIEDESAATAQLAAQARPAQRLATEGSVPLSQPIPPKSYPDSPPAIAYDSAEPPF